MIDQATPEQVGGMLDFTDMPNQEILARVLLLRFSLAAGSHALSTRGSDKEWRTQLTLYGSREFVKGGLNTFEIVTGFQINPNLPINRSFSLRSYITTEGTFAYAMAFYTGHVVPNGKGKLDTARLFSNTNEIVYFHAAANAKRVHADAVEAMANQCVFLADRWMRDQDIRNLGLQSPYGFYSGESICEHARKD